MTTPRTVERKGRTKGKNYGWKKSETLREREREGLE